MLSDGVLTSPKVDALSAEAERFFYRLLVVCDDYGCMDSRPEVLRCACFPLRIDVVKAEHIEAWLTELSDAGLIKRYLVETVPYLYYIKWNEHQRLRSSRPKHPWPRGGLPQVAASCGDLRPSRREEKGREGNRREGTSTAVVSTPVATDQPVLVNPPVEWTPDLDPIRKHLEAMQAPGVFFDPAYWRQIDAYLGKHPTIAYLDELAKYLNYEHGKNGRRKHKNLRSGFSNWLRTAERIADSADQKRQQWQKR